MNYLIDFTQDILEMLDAKNDIRIVISLYERTHYAYDMDNNGCKYCRLIYINPGIQNPFEVMLMIAHECFHAYQDSLGTLVYPSDYDKFYRINPNLCYRYDFERDAISFAHLMMAEIIKIVKELAPNQDDTKILDYENKFNKPFNILGKKLANGEEIDLQRKLDESYAEIKRLFKPLIDDNHEVFKNWYVKNFTN